MLRGKVHQAEDTHWLAELQEGNTQAFSMLYDKYWADVLDEAYRRLQNLDQAKDVAQEVFIGLWSTAQSIRITNLPAWLHTVVRNQVLKALRMQGRFVSIGEMIDELAHYAEDADAAVLHRELVSAFERLIETLPDQQRLIFRMRYQQDLPPDEIAERLGLSPKTVRNHLGRALSRLKLGFFFVQVLLFFAGK